MSRSKNDGKGRLGGRAKGTPNKITADLRKWITEILINGEELFVDHLNNLEPREFIKVYVSLLEYVVPKRQRVDIDAQAEIRQNRILSNEEMKQLLKRLEEE